jgi:hypothetical protein
VPVTVPVTCVSAQVATFLSLIDSAWVGLGLVVESKVWGFAATLPLPLGLAVLVNVVLVNVGISVNSVDVG